MNLSVQSTLHVNGSHQGRDQTEVTAPDNVCRFQKPFSQQTSCMAGSRLHALGYTPTLLLGKKSRIQEYSSRELNNDNRNNISPYLCTEISNPNPLPSSTNDKSVHTQMTSLSTKEKNTEVSSEICFSHNSRC